MSTEIKYVIDLICKQINIIFSTNLKPECFRLAKFNKTENNVVSVLWNTLSLLTTKQDQVDIGIIKNQMKTLGYHAETFYSLPEAFSSGSRELLLAIAFVIAKNLRNLVHDEIKKSPFDDSFSLIDLNIQVEKPEIPPMYCEKDMKNFITWLKGRIRQNEKMDKDYETQIKKIYGKLNALLNFKATESLKLNEVLALSSKKYCIEFLEKSSHIMDLLELHQEWTRKEKIFWKWMATVLEEKDKEYNY